MSELRKDPIVQRWVIIAAERGQRPSDFRSETTVKEINPRACPLCPHNEDRTPPEVYAVRPDGSQPNTPGWLVRVVPNKFPALRRDGEVRRKGWGMFDSMDGIGEHEVVIETPDHSADWDTMSLEHLCLVLKTYQVRLTALMQDSRFRYILIFRNYGAQAGASLSHPHSQIIALPIVPQLPKEELNAARRYFLDKERCLFCDLIAQEQALGQRVVYESEHLVALSPFAARFPYELHLFPKSHSHDFAKAEESILADFAFALHRLVRAVKELLGNPSYNFVLHTAPNPVPRPGRPDYWGTLPYDYHWHLEFIPRLTRIAGFEWGTGFYINPVSPEAAADALREALAAVTATVR
jgi:UDPglucose--hexose-1-phosphate uridylyltransferase